MKRNDCPKCKAELNGSPIPGNQRELFGGATHFSRKIGLVDLGRDRVVRWKCPDCGHEWPGQQNDRLLLI